MPSKLGLASLHDNASVKCNGMIFLEKRNPHKRKVKSIYALYGGNPNRDTTQDE